MQGVITLKQAEQDIFEPIRRFWEGLKNTKDITDKFIDIIKSRKECPISSNIVISVEGNSCESNFYELTSAITIKPAKVLSDEEAFNFAVKRRNIFIEKRRTLIIQQAKQITDIDEVDIP